MRCYLRPEGSPREMERLLICQEPLLVYQKDAGIGYREKGLGFRIRVEGLDLALELGLPLARILRPCVRHSHCLLDVKYRFF